METKQWTFLDKASWPERGPWDNEPDKVQWTDEATGLPCLVVRARAHWCGYVGVAEGHPAFGKDDEDVGVSVHGGITFSAFCHEGPGDNHVCHVPGPGEPDRVWWLGFDCAHAGDRTPATHKSIHDINLKYPMPKDYEDYRDLAYVQNECRSLAKQLAAMR